jgi:hypothetical protein
MRLRTTNYVFWADVQTSEDSDEIDVFIGNPGGSPRPCMVLTVYGRELVLQDIVYYATCSAPKSLEHGSGTVEMIQGALKAILATYPLIDKVYLTDKSYFPRSARGGGNIPLPELHAIVHGATWYQRHFGAVPDIRTVRVLDPYLRKRTQLMENSPNLTVAEYVSELKSIDEPTLIRIIETLGLKRLTGTSWEIPRAVVEQYPITARLEEDTSHVGGTTVVFQRTRASIPYIAGRIRV